jgi:hypothetical protein
VHLESVKRAVDGSSAFRFAHRPGLLANRLEFRRRLCIRITVIQRCNGQRLFPVVAVRTGPRLAMRTRRWRDGSRQVLQQQRKERGEYDGLVGISDEEEGGGVCVKDVGGERDALYELIKDRGC